MNSIENVVLHGLQVNSKFESPTKEIALVNMVNVLITFTPLFPFTSQPSFPVITTQPYHLQAPVVYGEHPNTLCILAVSHIYHQSTVKWLIATTAHLTQ